MFDVIYILDRMKLTANIGLLRN